MWCAIRWCKESFKPTRRILPPTAALDGGRMLELDVSYAARRPWVPARRQLAAWAAAALGSMRRPAVLSVRIVGRARSRSLNSQYRHRDKPTNVLSFGGAGTVPD